MTAPGSPDWASPVTEPVPVASVPGWDEQADVVVVGFGGAGVVAALAAREAGADVVALDRFGGGGATAISGGVVYAGGTPYQRDNGYDDDAEQLFRYLSLEVGDAVSEATLRRFCEDSAANLAWLEHHGVPFEGSLCPVKTSYPTNRYYLYFSGNEAIRAFAAAATPAPRGHRAKGRGLPGAALYAPLRESARRLGVQVRTQTQVTALVVDEGRVVGVRARRVSGPWRWVHGALWRLSLAVRNYLPRLARRCIARAAALEEAHGRTVHVRGDAVVLATGGFVHNRQMVETYAAPYRRGMPLGTAGCDGSGIRLGQSVGAGVDRMDRVSAWRFINPPMAWAKGVFVDRAGERYCNEAVYGAKLGRHMVEEHGGEGILVLDAALRREAFAHLGPGKAQWFQQAPALVNMLLNSRTADTLEGLAARIGVPAAALVDTVAPYNAGVAEGSDALGKPPEMCQALAEPPYHAMDCGIASRRFPCPTLTLGGLVVDEATGTVCSEDGAPVWGLYAAGRVAVGVSSNNYVSGLSLADCVFSGRRAGEAAARAVSHVAGDRPQDGVRATDGGRPLRCKP